MDDPLINQLIEEPLRQVDAIIREHLHSEVALINQIASYIINAGGKRLRPILTILAGQAIGYHQPALYELAAMVECIHTATLLHDDVVDESSTRRNRETANNLFGNAASVLVGDFLYTRAFQLMVRTQNLRILTVMAETTNIIAEGEVLQLMNIGNTEINEQQYLAVIQSKTAKLFESAARLAALAADAPPEYEQALATYGKKIGTAFQIIDDVLDYTGETDKIGKMLGNDLSEGKPTLPLIYTMQHGNPDSASVVRTALKSCDRNDFQTVLSAIQSCHALDYARRCAEKIALQAVDALAPLPDSQAKQALTALAQASVTRQT